MPPTYKTKIGNKKRGEIAFTPRPLSPFKPPNNDSEVIFQGKIWHYQHNHWMSLISEKHCFGNCGANNWHIYYWQMMI